VTVGDLLGVDAGGPTSLHDVDPETDLDAIARDLAEVEAELERLAEGTHGDDADTSPRPAES
jgi:hypothetical protein